MRGNHMKKRLLSILFLTASMFGPSNTLAASNSEVQENAHIDQAADLQENPAPATFNDLSSQYTFYDEVLFLAEKKIISGFKDGTFRTDDHVTRAQAAIMIGRALHLNSEPRNTKFKDVTTNVTGSGYIASAIEKGIITGFKDGTFRPYEPVNRGQMAMFIDRAFELTDGKIIRYADIYSNMTSYQAILNLTANGIVTGYPDGSYRPEQSLNRGQFSAFMARTLEPSFRTNNQNSNEPDPTSNGSALKEIYLNKLAALENQEKQSVYFYTAELLEVYYYNLQLWEDAMSEIENVLQNQLSPAEWNALKNEQQQWSVQREKAAQTKYDQEGGGSLSRVVYAETLATVTKERCYELVQAYMN